MSVARQTGEVALRVRGLSKSYGPVKALNDFDLDVRYGRLTAIVGDNGAGKSTLMKLLSGAIQRDTGSVELRGQPVHHDSPLAARAAGIETIFQELALCQNLDAVSNIFLGRELTRRRPVFPFLKSLDEAAMARRAGAELERLQVRLPQLVGTPVGRMSGGQRQAVAIARAAYWASDVLLMDEPTAALGVAQSRAVLDLISRVVQDGMAVLMVSHVMPHVIDLADHVVVLRHGEKVADFPGRTVNTEELVRLIVGETAAA